MPSGTDRFVGHLIGQALAPEDGLAQAKVTAINSGIVTVSYMGGSYQFPYLSSYTPCCGASGGDGPVTPVRG
jgi:hypothetical protein